MSYGAVVKDNWSRMRRWYEEQPFHPHDRIPWIIDQIIDSQYSDALFPLRSHDSLHIELTNDWRVKGIPKICIHPTCDWLTIRYCHYKEPGNDEIDEYKITIDKLDQIRGVLFELLARLKEFQIN
jgi:hypothetical protein